MSPNPRSGRREARSRALAPSARLEALLAAPPAGLDVRGGLGELAIRLETLGYVQPIPCGGPGTCAVVVGLAVGLLWVGICTVVEIAWLGAALQLPACGPAGLAVVNAVACALALVPALQHRRITLVRLTPGRIEIGRWSVPLARVRRARVDGSDTLVLEERSSWCWRTTASTAELSWLGEVIGAMADRERGGLSAVPPELEALLGAGRGRRHPDRRGEAR